MIGQNFIMAMIRLPPELNKPLSPNELMETLRKIKD